MFTFRYNFPQVPTFCGDIRDLNHKRLSHLLDSAPDWVVGGPPCQGFSTVGRRKRDDPRNKLFDHFARIIRELQPQGFIAENVLGLRDMDFLGQTVSLFEGYRVTPVVVTAANYGVPQLRRRIFFIGDKRGRVFRMPAPTHNPVEYVSVWDAIGDLPPLEPGEKASTYATPPLTNYQRALRGDSEFLQGHQASKHPQRLVKAISYIPDGGNRTAIPARYQPRSGFHNSYSRLHSKSPAVAVTQNMGKPSGTRCIHPFQHRGLTSREGARLQGFPDEFYFLGGSQSQRLQIANAISPILAQFIGRAVLDPRNWRKADESNELSDSTRKRAA